MGIPAVAMRVSRRHVKVGARPGWACWRDVRCTNCSACCCNRTACPRQRASADPQPHAKLCRTGVAIVHPVMVSLSASSAPRSALFCFFFFFPFAPQNYPVPTPQCPIGRSSPLPFFPPSLSTVCRFRGRVQRCRRAAAALAVSTVSLVFLLVFLPFPAPLVASAQPGPIVNPWTLLPRVRRCQPQPHFLAPLCCTAHAADGASSPDHTSSYSVLSRFSLCSHSALTLLSLCSRPFLTQLAPRWRVPTPRASTTSTGNGRW